jgi:WD40 repeat protein
MTARRRHTRVSACLSAALAALALAGVAAQAPPATARPLPARAATASPGAPARIAYVSLGSVEHVWSANASGGERRLLGPGSSPLVSPDGSLVAAALAAGNTYTGEASGSILLYPTTGGSPRTISELPGEEARPLAFSPDSHYLAVELSSEQTSTSTRVARSGLAVVDLETGVVTLVARGVIAGASFDPSGGDELVYGADHGLQRFESKTPVDLYLWSPGASSPQQLTHDGHSLNPVWGPQYIAFDHERLRGRYGIPAYQIWLTTPQGPAHAMTSFHVGQLSTGLVPIGFSSSGSRLLAELEQQDIPEAYAVSVPSGHARRIAVRGNEITIATGFSSTGSSLLVTIGIYATVKVARVPYAGGRATVLATHASEGSWNE